MKPTCPHCRKTLPPGASPRQPFFPFCSERCKMADLGMWFREEHGISEKPDGPPGAGGKEPAGGGNTR